MVHINLKNAAISETELAVDVAVNDLPRVNAALMQLIAHEAPTPGPLEGSTETPEYPEDVKAFGLPTVPRLYGELHFRQCPGTKLPLIEGNLTGQVPLRCQACLTPYLWQMNIDVKLAHIYKEERESDVPEGYEAFLHERPDVTLVELLEDDILLSLPTFPKHPEGKCQALVEETPEEQEEVKKKISPFAGLKDLLNKSDSE